MGWGQISQFYNNWRYPVFDWFHCIWNIKLSTVYTYFGLSPALLAHICNVSDVITRGGFYTGKLILWSLVCHFMLITYQGFVTIATNWPKEESAWTTLEFFLKSGSNSTYICCMFELPKGSQNNKLKYFSASELEIILQRVRLRMKTDLKIKIFDIKTSPQR